MSKTVIIGKHEVGNFKVPFIIAEVGINHNGSVELAKKLIDIAAEAGADAVKFQKRTLNVVYTHEELAKPREFPAEIAEHGIARKIFTPEEVARIRSGKTINGDQKRILEFGESEYRELMDYAHLKGLLLSASPWDEESVDFLDRLGVPFYKIASACLTDRSLLQKIKSKNKPVILSTGMSTMDEIRKALEILGKENTILLHCTSTYPAGDKEINLRAMNTLMEKFEVPIGYSGHEPGVYPSIMAAALGAAVIERHITLGRAMYGSDQAASLEPRDFRTVVQGAKRAQEILGSPEKNIQPSEVSIKTKLRRVDTL